MLLESLLVINTSNSSRWCRQAMDEQCQAARPATRSAHRAQRSSTAITGNGSRVGNCIMHLRAQPGQAGATPTASRTRVHMTLRLSLLISLLVTPHLAPHFAASSDRPQEARDTGASLSLSLFFSVSVVSLSLSLSESPSLSLHQKRHATQGTWRARGSLALVSLPEEA